VACEVASKDGLSLQVLKWSKMKTYDGRTDVLPAAVQRWYGFSQPDPALLTTTASGANDVKGLSFAEIADQFEQVYLPADYRKRTTNHA